MKCYFCQNELEEDKSRNHSSYAPKYKSWLSCQHCTSTYGLHEVHTSQSMDDDSVVYAHIYPDEQTYGQIYGRSNIPGAAVFYYPTNTTYHIRLNIQENTTTIRRVYGDDSPDILVLPGFPIRPENVREKLKLYLLFS